MIFGVVTNKIIFLFFSNNDTLKVSLENPFLCKLKKKALLHPIFFWSNHFQILRTFSPKKQSLLWRGEQSGKYNINTPFRKTKYAGNQLAIKFWENRDFLQFKLHPTIFSSIFMFWECNRVHSIRKSYYFSFFKVRNLTNLTVK